MAPRSLVGAGPTRAAALAFIVLAHAPDASAQTLRGRVLSEVDGAPLASAYVVLAAEAGAVVARTLSSASGAFVLEAPRPGRYTVSAEHIGFATAQARVSLEAGGDATVELRAGVHVIELEGLVAEADQECHVDPSVGIRLAALWEEVSKAFQVTAFVEEKGTFLMETDRWRRKLDPERMRVLEEERHPSRGFQSRSPFVSLPAERLAGDGYIQEDGSGGYVYYGPDASVLMSDSFRDTHCFGFTDAPPRDGDRDWVGIRFRPREGGTMDIAGTLWIEEATYEPRRLDYRYANLPYPLATDQVGGRVEFTRIPMGPWIVRRWRIRVPETRARRVSFGAAPPELRYELAALWEDGGEVLRVRPFGEADYVSLGRLGRVEGTVVSGAATVADARVSLTGTVLHARTDGRGRFAFGGVPEGRYTLSWTSPAFDSLWLRGAEREIDVRAGKLLRVDAALPALADAVADACGAPLVDEETGVLRGRLSDANGRTPVGAVVRVEWAAIKRVAAYRPTSESPVENVRIDTDTTSASLLVGPDGVWTACGLPDDASMSVWVEIGDGDDAPRGERVSVRLARGEVRVLDLAVPGG